MDLYQVISCKTGKLVMIAPEDTIADIYRLHTSAVSRFKAAEVILYGNGKREDILVKYCAEEWQATGEQP